jgi:hypothetical protein
MIPVMASTNIDRLKIDFAGVDSGVKILVGLARKDLQRQPQSYSRIGTRLSAMLS